MKTGIYFDLSNAEYHGGPGVNKSLLDIVNKSPLHAKFAIDQRAENDNKNESTPAQIIGSAFHSLLLEPEKFDSEYVVAPKFDRRTNAGKAGYEAFMAENEGKQFIDQDTLDQLLGMAHAARLHPAAAALLSGDGVAEASVYWLDQQTGEICRCRPDYWRKDGVIVDVKTTDDASPEEFGRSVAKWRYHVQSAMYSDGLSAAYQAGDFPTGYAAPKAFAFLVVEKKPPYAVAVYILDAESVALGNDEYRRNLSTLIECQKTGAWPGYGDNIQMIGVPNWYLNRATTAA